MPRQTLRAVILRALLLSCLSLPSPSPFSYAPCSGRLCAPVLWTSLCSRALDVSVLPCSGRLCAFPSPCFRAPRIPSPCSSFPCSLFLLLCSLFPAPVLPYSPVRPVLPLLLLIPGHFAVFAVHQTARSAAAPAGLVFMATSQGEEATSDVTMLLAPGRSAVEETSP